jgi:hypothetical protein
MTSHQVITNIFRRKYLNNFLKQFGDGKTKIASTATPFFLGSPNSMTSSNPELKQAIDQAYEHGLKDSNPRTLSEFIPEITSSPHPRFLGLA